MSDQMTIKVQDNGPYLVTNCRMLKDGDGHVYTSEGTVELCRCGGSKNKPYCDGTHATSGFSGEKSPDREPDRRVDYAGHGGILSDNRGICAHSGHCTKLLPKVFKVGAEVWIDAAGDEPELIQATVLTCPSGAISYWLDGVDYRDTERPPAILIAPNGPYAIQGGANLPDVTWEEGASREHFTLCRCGHSRNKPFCSGDHRNHSFDERAPKKGG